MDWGLALSTTATGLVVVFLVLAILIIVVSILGKIMSSITNRKSREKVTSHNKQEMQQQAETMEANTSVQIEPEDGISDEIVAAISAAVAVIMSAEGKSYRIRSVKRNKDNRPAWSAAGIRDNTRPF